MVSQYYDSNKFRYNHVAAHQAVLLKLKLLPIAYCRSALASQRLMMTIIKAAMKMKMIVNTAMKMKTMIYITPTRTTQNKITGTARWIFRKMITFALTLMKVLYCQKTLMKPRHLKMEQLLALLYAALKVWFIIFKLSNTEFLIEVDAADIVVCSFTFIKALLTFNY